MIHIKYFASIREQLEVSSEEIAVNDLSSVEDLLCLLKGRGGLWSYVLGAPNVQVAVNHVHAQYNQSIVDGDEIAFLPPVTGG